MSGGGHADVHCWKLPRFISLWTKGSRKNNFTEWALGFGSDLADPIEQNRRHSRLCRGFASEVSGKDGRKPRWQNVKLFLREPLVFQLFK